VNTLIHKWLDTFTSAVRNKDFKSAKNLYYENGVFFGTNHNCSKNIEEYSNLQWEMIWNSSRDFNFTEVLDSSLHDDIGYCLTTWSNITKENYREGRATFIFKIFDGKLLVIHSHFSENINPANDSF
jgi:ketosteroid isomerase-like protein